MEMGDLWWSLPADDGEVFGPILSDPLDWPLFSTAKPMQPEGGLYSTYEDDATMDIQHLLYDPRDEQDLDECLRGPPNPSGYSCETNLTPEVEGVICSPTRDDGITVQAPGDPKINLLDSIPKGDWRCGPRGPRKRRAFSSNSKKCLGQKNNSHWTPEEVTELVEGVSRIGVGRWTELKKNLFSKSVRTSVNLKDKWRNLLEACGVESNPKNKGKAPKTMIQSLNRKLIKRIRKLALDNPYPRPKQ